MDDELGRDIVDGTIVDWSELSEEELRKMKASTKAKEKAILEEINRELENDDELGL